MGKALQSLIDRTYRSPQPYSGDARVDANVLVRFPERTEIISANRYGTSNFAATVQLHLKFPDGSDQQYLLKYAPGANGRTTLEGEYNSISELYKWVPDLVPKLHSWGRCTLQEPESYFLLVEFVDFIGGMPDPEQLCTKIARLHRESRSPNGQFGFHITTCLGRTQQLVSWEQVWTTFFMKLLRHAIEVDVQGNGPWEELDKLEKRLVTQVVPRLLDALEDKDGKVKPSLIHSDLWEGNIGVSSKNGDIYIFDAACFYAHHEMEAAYWRPHMNNISDRLYMSTYLRHFSPSEPKNEWDDRNRLYSVYYNIIYSANHLSQGRRGRELAYRDMYHLVDKFAPFSNGEGVPRLNESELTHISTQRDLEASMEESLRLLSLN
ncbi:Fructosamine kinase-domain-containing protein [Ilyonectria robusta]|uniref:Fructosamine kinase-domain-containing protein n=1 Tax=Ilyonectria robusta TaxID=1079257 RepID=UPI001E8ED241|nr:Fructosamine kinase-domain-containing protein [Ilyonectria robusta]KAH8648118.1 Fructosamine kinase-domain-containing protein [Ilyonectria robusta]